MKAIFEKVDQTIFGVRTMPEWNSTSTSVTAPS